MADYIRKRIVQDIKSALTDIRIVNGYKTDIGGNVIMTKIQIDPDLEPFVVLHPQIEEAEAIHGKSKQIFDIQIEGHSAFGPLLEAWEVAEDMIGDIIARITNKANKASTLADSIVYSGGGVDQYPDAGEKLVAVRANFNVVYKFVAGSPDSQT